jgi:hypothetical protein
MRETKAELDELQGLLDASHRDSTEHLRGIIDDGRTLTAREIAGLMTGMRILSLATVTQGGEPRISAVDGHFLRARWIFSTSGAAAKARHLRARNAASAAHVDGEEVAIFTHGRVAFLEPGSPMFEATVAHLTEHYGSSPLSWGPDIVICRVEPTWMVGYAFRRDELLNDRNVPIDSAHRT